MGGTDLAAAVGDPPARESDRQRGVGIAAAADAWREVPGSAAGAAARKSNCGNRSRGSGAIAAAPDGVTRFVPPARRGKECLEMFQTASHSAARRPAQEDRTRTTELREERSNEEWCPRGFASPSAWRAGAAPLLALRHAEAARIRIQARPSADHGGRGACRDDVPGRRSEEALGRPHRRDGVPRRPARRPGRHRRDGASGRGRHSADRRAVPRQVCGRRRGPSGALPDGRSPANSRSCIGSAWLDDLNNRLAAKGFRVISWSNYFGTRQISLEEAHPRAGGSRRA